jgi:photosystem II stability/assembly factor-like uncharacterized protein
MRNPKGISLLLLMLMVMSLIPAAALGGTMRDFFREWDARYAQFIGRMPSEVNTSGTGFKPYMRFKDFFERRLGPDDDLVPGARWRAFQQLREMEQRGRAGATWFSLGPVNVAGRCLAIEVHPQNSAIVYAGFASGGLWKSTDGGNTWMPLGDDLPTLAVSAIEIDPNNPDRIWIGTGEGWGNIDAVHGVGLLRSTDGGQTWETTGYNYEMNANRDVYELEYNPVTGTLLLAADNGLYRSTDGGDTFDAIFTLGQWKDVELQRGSSNVVFACAHAMAEAGFYRSTDDGLTWTRITAGTPTSDMGNMRFALTDADPNIIYWAIAKGGGQMKGIWKSTDGGLSFSQVYVPGQNHYLTQGWYNLTIDVSPTDPDIVFSGGVYFFKSTNGGSSFVQFANNIHVDHHATAWDPSNPNIFWVGSDGGVWRSVNGGTSFQDKNNGLVTLQFYAMNHSVTLPTRALGGTQDNGTWVYNNSQNWSYVLGGDGFFTEVDYQDENIVYAELYYGEHYRSMNGGPGMYPINNGITEAGPWSTPTHMDFSDPATLYTAHNTTVFKTTNRGNSWFPITTESIYGSGTSIHQCRNQPDVLVVTSKLKVWVSTDHGATWEDRSSGLITGSSISDVHVHPDDPNIILVTLSSYNPNLHQIYKTTDQGLSWFPIDEGLPDEPINSVEIDPSHPDWYFIGTDLGVYVSFDAGATWTPFNVGLPHAVVADIRIHDQGRFLRAATHGRGMWEVDISNLNPSDVGSGEVRVEPLMLRVMGNPANGRTTLRYGLREPGQVRLGLYDVRGRLLRTLVDRFAYPALDNVELDVADLPSGLYFVRLEAHGRAVTRKVVVQR